LEGRPVALEGAGGSYPPVHVREQFGAKRDPPWFLSFVARGLLSATPTGRPRLPCALRVRRRAGKAGQRRGVRDPEGLTGP